MAYLCLQMEDFPFSESDDFWMNQVKQNVVSFKNAEFFIKKLKVAII